MNGDHISAYRWILAIGAIGAILFAFSRLRVGYVVIYYLAVLSLLFILLTQYQGIAWVLNPFTQLDQQGQPSAEATTLAQAAADAAQKVSNG